MIGYNQPGMGLGFSAGKQMAHGLGTAFVIVVGVVKREVLRLMSYINRVINLSSELGP